MTTALILTKPADTGGCSSRHRTHRINGVTVGALHESQRIAGRFLSVAQEMPFFFFKRELFWSLEFCQSSVVITAQIHKRGLRLHSHIFSPVRFRMVLSSRRRGAHACTAAASPHVQTKRLWCDEIHCVYTHGMENQHKKWQLLASLMGTCTFHETWPSVSCWIGVTLLGQGNGGGPSEGRALHLKGCFPSRGSYKVHPFICRVVPFVQRLGRSGLTSRSLLFSLTVPLKLLCVGFLRLTR